MIDGGAEEQDPKGQTIYAELLGEDLGVIDHLADFAWQNRGAVGHSLQGAVLDVSAAKILDCRRDRKRYQITDSTESSSQKRLVARYLSGLIKGLSERRPDAKEIARASVGEELYSWGEGDQKALDMGDLMLQHIMQRWKQ